MSEEDKIEFNKLTDNVIEFINKKANPHCTVIITNTHAELLEGICSNYTENFIVD